MERVTIDGMSRSADTRPFPRGPRLALAGMFAFLVLMPIALGALDSGDLRCTRDGVVRCEYVKTLVGMERDRRRVEDVTDARVEFSPAKKGSGTYRAVLLTRAGEVPLSDSFNYNEELARALADRVSSFAHGKESAMVLTQPGWGWQLVLGTSLFWSALAWWLPRLSARQARAADAGVDLRT